MFAKAAFVSHGIVIKRRPWVAAMLALLLALQGMVLAAGWSGHFAHRENSVASAIYNHDCSSDIGDPSNAPGKQKGHVGCCVFCQARGFDDLFLKIYVQAETWFVAPTRRSVSFRLDYKAPKNLPSGMNTSWSAQAPPAAANA